MRNRWWIGALVLMACGGGSKAGTVEPSNAPPPTPESAVRAFLQAVADSNIDRMASLWGSEKGPASRTRQPADYVKRMEVIQIYLRNSPYTIGAVSKVEGDASRNTVAVVFDRKACVRTMPVTVLQTPKDGWIINQLDLNQAGSPTRPCRNAGDDPVKPKP